MKKLFLVLGAVALVAPALRAQSRAPALPELRLAWATSVPLGMEEARLRNVPIVLHIHGDT